MNVAVALLCFVALDVRSDQMIVEDHVDLIELNHCLDHRGNLAFRQLIFYDWSKYHRRFQVRDTVVVMSNEMIPKRNALTGQHVAMWRDGSKIRAVHSLSYRITKTKLDPEVPERNYLPIHLRRKLTAIKDSQLERSPSDSAPIIRTATRIKPIPLIKE